LLEGDPTATRDFLLLYLAPLLSWLRGKRRAAPPDLVQQAVNDALLDLCRRPGTFDPQRDPDLFRFLRRAASCDLSNALSAERRRTRKEILVGVVEDGPHAGNEEEEADPVRLLMARESQQSLARLRDHLERTLPERDRGVLRLLLDGERRTAAYARALGLQGEPSEFRREVKRAKDRVQKHLRREGQRHGRPT
jgi:hypothetical protein